MILHEITISGHKEVQKACGLHLAFVEGVMRVSSDQPCNGIYPPSLMRIMATSETARDAVLQKLKQAGVKVFSVESCCLGPKSKCGDWNK